VYIENCSKLVSIWQIFWARRLIISYTCVSVYCPAKSWSTCLQCDIWQTATVVTATHYNAALILTLGPKIIKWAKPNRQLTLSEWLNVICVQRQFAAASSWLLQVHTFDQSMGFLWCHHGEYVFVSEPNDDKSLGNIFKQLYFNHLIRFT